MSGLSSPGIGSGLDVNSLVTKLMDIERQPLTALDTKEASYQAQLSALGTIKGQLSSLQAAAAKVSDAAAFLAMKTSVADATLFSASAASNAAAGSYSVEVKTLAQAQKLKSGAFAQTTDAVGTGTLTIQFGTYSGGAFTANPDKAVKTITIGSGQGTLAGVRDAINAADAGVTATIVNDGTGNRLVLSSKDSGVANALKVTVADDDGNATDAAGLSQLAYDASTGGTANLTETVAAADATLMIDGMAVTKSSNTVTDAIEGVTLNLAKATPGSPTTLTVSRDTAAVKAQVDAFVKAYNDASKMLRDATAYNASTKKGAIFQGDATVRDLQNQLRNLLNQPLAGAGGGLARLSDIGITFQKDGSLALDSTKLQKVLDDPSKDISTLFAAVGKPTDTLVKYSGAAEGTKAGNYSVNITQAATKGTVVGGVTLAGSTVITAGVNDTLSVTIDGTDATITLGAGSYTPDQLAAELQSKINGASAIFNAGAAVTVKQSGGVLSITSDKYGSTSKVAVTGGNAQATLLGTPDATNATGKDVAGTIGGGAATGSGQTLTAIGGDATGLILTVDGSTTGSRGTVNFSRGFAYQLDKLVSRMLATDGQIAARTDGINRSVKDIDSRRDALNVRLDLVEKRYRAQFTALDTLIANMNQTSAYLTQQLANLPKAGS